MTARSSEGDWVELETGKETSRILYPNPVCFLGTTSRKDKVAASAANANGTATSNESNNCKDLKCDRVLKETREGIAVEDGENPDFVPIEGREIIPDGASVQRNVMVLTWLTATNNEGRFMFSINRGRYSATNLKSCEVFTLSVPVKGMEDLVRDVGSVSGRWGSKFPQDFRTSDSSQRRESNDLRRSEERAQETTSKRRLKRLRKQRHATRGVPGLCAVPVGHRVVLDPANRDDRLFAVTGTVAHLVCRAYHIMDCNDVIDADHYLVLAEITKAYVHPAYWDSNKNLFRPQRRDCLPYLTFFGSKMFGHVRSEEQDANKEEKG